MRTHARSVLCNSLGKSSAKELEAGKYTRAVELLTRLLAVPDIGPDELARGESNLAACLAKLGVYLHAHMYVHMHVYMHAYMHACVHMHV